MVDFLYQFGHDLKSKSFGDFLDFWNAKYQLQSRFWTMSLSFGKSETSKKIQRPSSLDNEC